MYLNGLVIRTKLAPLRSFKRTLYRPRLGERIREATDYRLTILQAGAGYGKSTALAALANGDAPVVWYHLGTEDTDPLLFLLYLLHGFNHTFKNLSEAPLAMLEAWEGAGGSIPWSAIVDLLINELAEVTSEHFLLVLDDVHLLNDVPEARQILDRLIKHGPANLHIVLSTRYPLALANLITLRVRGDLLEIGEDELAFTPGEIQALFSEQQRIELDAAEIERLAKETEGWAIAVQLINQHLSHLSQPDLSKALKQFSGLKEDLFVYLAQEVFDQQAANVRDFLLTTSILRRITIDACDHLRDAADNEYIFKQLASLGLFVVEMDEDHIRYHHLFGEFLYRRLDAAVRQETHLKAAAYYDAKGESEEAVYHYLEAEAFNEAARVIKKIGRSMVLAGRLETLSTWFGQLPPETLERYPTLLIPLGDIARLRSRFDEALRWYQLAEERCRAQKDQQGIAQALRGQARVYLDTVNPSQAEHLLSEALRHSDGQEDRETRANLLELMAENQLNLGHAHKAREFQNMARDLREQSSDKVELSARVLLRTGRLSEVSQMLEKRAEVENREPVFRPRAHRETLLLLSLLQSYIGESELAYQNAVEGIKRGQIFNSPFITAVGYMRQGHAWLLRDAKEKYRQAIASFDQAIEISDSLGVERLKVEAYWGLCRAYGYRGQLSRAEDVAGKGIQIAEKAGDSWIKAHICTSMGAAYILAGRPEEAPIWFTHGLSGYRECSDTYGEALSRLWQSLMWYALDDRVRLEQVLDDLLHIAYMHDYDHLLTRRVMGGPPDPRCIVPLLLVARGRNIRASYAGSLLNQLGLEKVEFHPGYQLRVQVLGAFRVWQGEEEVDSSDWQREKARQLFQLLITWRGSLLERDKICGLLWPELSADAAVRGFKVALNALYNALEPGRKRGASSAYVVREGSLYGLRMTADTWLDVDEFERAASTGDGAFQPDPVESLASYRYALEIYQGDYLEEFPYDEWCNEERTRLRTIYLRVADRVARTLVDQGQWEEALAVCQQILAHDDCWENAYRLMMICYTRLGNKASALRSYQQAVERIQDQLETGPSPETIRLYEQILESTL